VIGKDGKMPIPRRSVVDFGGSDRFNDSKNFPWIIPFDPKYAARARCSPNTFSANAHPPVSPYTMRTTISAATTSGAKTWTLRQGIRYVRRGVEPQLSDPMIDARVVDLNGADTDVLIQFTQSKFAAQVIRIAAWLNWHPLHLIATNAGSIGRPLSRRGTDAWKGLITATWERNPADHRG
jgi:branched-chain amino acid transport system substrate-binding protein